MAIEFPQPRQDNPFDRWKWVANAKSPLQQNQPNLGRPGVPFSKSNMNPGLGNPKSVSPKLNNIVNVNGAVVTPPPLDTPAICDSATRRTFYRVTATQNMVLSGVSRDIAGNVLGNCTVIVFRTEDNSFVAKTTSDVSGNWSIPIVVGGPFFLVEYKAGTPDVAGTSVNTLLPTVA
jgi:hypothetical protein